jgi:hypothetical protein
MQLFTLGTIMATKNDNGGGFGFLARVVVIVLPVAARAGLRSKPTPPTLKPLPSIELPTWPYTPSGLGRDFDTKPWDKVPPPGNNNGILGGQPESDLGKMLRDLDKSKGPKFGESR